jgi:threonine synthase
LAQAFEEGASEATAWPEARAGLAEGVICPRPARDREVLAAVRDSGGLITTVDDMALDNALRLLWRENLRVEPTAALPVAYLLDADGRRALTGVHDVVVVLTGRGVRDGQPIFSGL